MNTPANAAQHSADDTLRVNRFQLHRVLQGNEEAPAEWHVAEPVRSVDEHADGTEAPGIGAYVNCYAVDLARYDLPVTYGLFGQTVIVGGRVLAVYGRPRAIVALIEDVSGLIEVELPATTGDLVEDDTTLLVRGEVVPPPAYTIRPTIRASHLIRWEVARRLGPDGYLMAAAADAF